MSLEHLKRPSDTIPDRYQINRNNSPLTNKKSVFDPNQIDPYSVTTDNSKIITIGTRNQGDIDISTGTAYYPRESSNISSDFNPIVGSDVGRDYENRIYGVNAYKGSNKDDEIGGIFNSPLQKYSTVFRTINTPTLNDIVDSGNTETRGGFPNKKVAVDIVQSTYTVTPTRYFENGQINISGTDFNKRGINVEGIPLVNPINASGLQFRTRDVDASNLLPNVLGQGELRESKLPTELKSSLDARRGLGLSIGSEPFVTFDTNGIANELSIGQSGGRGFPINSSRIDSYRVGQWMNNNVLLFLGRRTILTGQSVVVTKKGNEKLKRFSSPLQGLVSDAALPVTVLTQGITGGTAILERGYDLPIVDPTHVNNGLKYEKNIFSSNLAAGALNLFGAQVSDVPQQVDKSFLPKPTAAGFFQNLVNGLTGPRDNYDPKGDVHTNAGISFDTTGNGDFNLEQDNLSIGTNVQRDSDGSKEIQETYGLPFYFKDLRDNRVIIFRAYVNGINENVNPTWNPSQFIGRSEPIYNYSHGERDISLSLKLVAQTRIELNAIYGKMNRLTSLAYPQYQQDPNLNSKVRMKPPLVKFRYGDLYNVAGGPNEKYTGLLGFIQSITYTVPEEATYETESGMQVPKHVEAALTFKVIHTEVPDKESNFYGTFNRIREVDHKVLGDDMNAVGIPAQPNLG